MENLFENLDKSIFKPELVTALKAEFDTAVNENVEQSVLAFKAELVTENEQALETLKANLISENEVVLAEGQDRLAEKLNDYLTLVVEEIVADNEVGLADKEEKHKLQAMIEAFSGFALTAGVSVAQINESKDNVDSENLLNEQVENNNILVEENLAFKHQNEQLIQMGVILEMKSGMSIVQADKFERLSALVEFSNDASYAEKLETLKESVIGEKAVESEKVEPTQKLDESVQTVCASKHLY